MQRSFFHLSQKLAAILYESADEGGYVDPIKVSDVLGVYREEVASDIDPGDAGM